MRAAALIVIIAATVASAILPYPDVCSGNQIACIPGQTTCVPTDGGPVCLPVDRPLKMFVTQQQFVPKLDYDSVDAAHRRCHIEAKGAVGAVPGEVYFAYISNSTWHPHNSFFRGGSRYVNKQGQTVFADTAHIFQNAPRLATLTQHEDVSFVSDPAAAQPAKYWTGTTSYGEPYVEARPARPSFDCSNWKTNNALFEASVGDNSLVPGSNWASTIVQECSVPARLLCVQQNVVSMACAANPCSATQTCYPLLEENSYTCLDNPVSSVVQCSATTCLNGATCVDYVNHHKCFCADGFTGSDCSEPVATQTEAPAPAPGEECFGPFGKLVVSAVTGRSHCNCNPQYGFTESRCVQCHGVIVGSLLERKCVSSFSNDHCGFPNRKCTGVKKCTIVDNTAQCVVPDGVPDCNETCIGGQVCRFNAEGAAVCTSPDETPACLLQCETGETCQFINGEQVCAIPPITPGVCDGACPEGLICYGPPDGAWSCVPPPQTETPACLLSCESPLVCQFVSGEQVCSMPPITPETCSPGCAEGQICTGPPGGVWSCVSETPACLLTCETPLVCQFVNGEQTCAVPPIQPEVCTPGCAEGQICTGPPGGLWSCVTP